MKYDTQYEQHAYNCGVACSWLIIAAWFAFIAGVTLDLIGVI